MYSYIPAGGVKIKGIATFSRNRYVYDFSDSNGLGGLIYVSGCSRIERRIFAIYKWGERSVVFLKYKAEKGILEKIAIKEVLLNFKFGFYKPVYMDTLNSLYNEEELINEQQARMLAQAYINRRKAAIAESIRQCGGSG